MQIDHVMVNGRPASVVWNGGQPLPLSGTGGLDLGPDHVEVDRAGETWHLDLGTRLLVPGRYVAAAPVAVGAGGLAEPHDRVVFVAGATSAFVTNGDARIHLAPRPLHLTGPGRVRITGALTVRTAAGAHPANALTFGPGPFDLTLTPGPAGLMVHGLLQGSLTD